MPSKSKSRSRSKSKSPSISKGPCSPGKIRDVKTKRCREKKSVGAPLKYAPCSPGKIRDPETKRCREKKSRGRKVGQVAAIDAVARAIANKTRDAYSFDRYKNWVSVCKFLLKKEFTARETEEIVESKLMRWCYDHWNKRGKVPTSHFIKFFNENEDEFMEVAFDDEPIGGRSGRLIYFDVTESKSKSPSPKKSK
jgi:hypothetical protein